MLKQSRIFYSIICMIVPLYKNEFNKLSKKVKAIPRKGLTKDLINKFCVLNGANYFSPGIFENYLAFI